MTITKVTIHIKEEDAHERDYLAMIVQDKLLEKHIACGNLEGVKLILQTGFYHEMQRHFNAACNRGNLEIAKYIYGKAEYGGVDHNEEEDYLFWNACRNGYLPMAQWIYSLGGVNIHVDDDCVFRDSCNNGHLHVAQWLYTLGEIDIYAKKDFAFIQACKGNHINVINWLVSLNPTRYRVEYTCKNGKMIVKKHYVDLLKKSLKTAMKRSKKLIKYYGKAPQQDIHDMCPICLDNDADKWLKLPCNHMMCIDCYVGIDECPFRCKCDMNKVEFIKNVHQEKHEITAEV